MPTVPQTHFFLIPFYNADRPTNPFLSYPFLQCRPSHKPISFLSLSTMPTVPQTHFFHIPFYNADRPTNPFLSYPSLQCQLPHKPHQYVSALGSKGNAGFHKPHKPVSTRPSLNSPYRTLPFVRSVFMK